MNHPRLELAVGCFVLLGLAAVAYLAIHLGSGSLAGGDSYPLEARFANAGGLHPGSSVVLAGVTVGRVDRVRVDPTDYSAIVTMRVNGAVKLPADTMASVKTAGLIGDKYVALAPGADEAYLAPGERITLTEPAVDLESLIGKMAFGNVKEGPSPGGEPTAPATAEAPPAAESQP